MTYEQLCAARPKAPCERDCPERKPGCGAVCEKWIQYTAEREKWYAAKLKESQKRARPERSRRDLDRAPTQKKNNPGRL